MVLSVQQQVQALGIGLTRLSKGQAKKRQERKANGKTCHDCAIVGRRSYEGRHNVQNEGTVRDDRGQITSD